MGARVLHEDAVFPVIKVEIPINIRNTNRPEDNGTLIVKNADYYQTNLYISGISGKTGYVAFAAEKTGIGEDLQMRSDFLDVFAKKGITVKNILSGMDSLNIIVHQSEIEDIEEELLSQIREKVAPVEVEVIRNLAIIAVVGRDLGTSPAIAVKVLGALANRKINIKLIDHGSDKINMSIGVDGEDYASAVQAIYAEFTRK